jgi:hypothetical protein
MCGLLIQGARHILINISNTRQHSLSIGISQYMRYPNMMYLPILDSLRRKLGLRKLYTWDIVRAVSNSLLQMLYIQIYIKVSKPLWVWRLFYILETFTVH